MKATLPRQELAQCCDAVSCREPSGKLLISAEDPPTHGLLPTRHGTLTAQPTRPELRCLCTASSGCRPCWFMLTVLLFGGIFPSKYRVAFLSNFVFFKEGFPNCLGFSKGAKHLCCFGDVTLASAQHALLPWCPGPTCPTDVLDNTCPRVYNLHPMSGFIPIASYVVHGFIATTTL